MIYGGWLGAGGCGSGCSLDFCILGRFGSWGVFSGVGFAALGFSWVFLILVGLV